MTRLFSRLSLLFLFTFLFTAAASAAVAPATVRIHYSRSASDYAGWQLYTWYGALNPSPQWNPAQPQRHAKVRHLTSEDKTGEAKRSDTGDYR